MKKRKPAPRPDPAKIAAIDLMDNLVPELERLHALGLIVRMPQLVLPIDIGDIRLKLACDLLHEELRPLPVLRELDFMGAELAVRGVRFLPHTHLRGLQRVDLALTQ